MSYNRRNSMKPFFYVAACCSAVALLACPGWAGTEGDEKTAPAPETKPLEPVPLDEFKFESGYVFESDLNHGGSFGKQDEIQNEFEYAHRFQLSGNLYLHLGLSYDRYDFGSTAAPVPNHLQSIAGVVGVDYMHGKDVGAFFAIRPGFYTQNDIGISSFDIPITFGRIFVVRDEKLYFFLGGYVSFLSDYPFLPLPGVIWIVSDNVRVMGVAPNPRLIYSASKNLEVWLGGDFVGGAFRTDQNDNIRPHKLSGTQVDFTDYRAGLGLTYKMNDHVSFDLNGGCSIQRQFHFGRAGETYRTDPSPYVDFRISAKF